MTAIGHASTTDLPAVTPAQMREIDRLATHTFGIDLSQMMELAGANLAATAHDVFGALEGARVTILVGPGNNGGGGLVAARHLANRGAGVHVVLALPVGRLSPSSSERLETLIEMHVPCCVANWDLLDGELDELLAASQLLIDALLGYAADGPPRGDVAKLVERAAASGTPVLSLDVPSGIDPETGRVNGHALRAAATMTIAVPKRGLLTDVGRRHSGRLYLADVGLPAAVYGRAGLHFADPFRAGPVVHLD